MTHNYLVIPNRYHLSRDAAERQVLSTLRFLFPDHRSADLRHRAFKESQRGGEWNWSFRDLVQRTRETGCAGPAQALIDSRDLWFGGILPNMSVDGESMSLGSQCAGLAVEVRGPACIHRIEHELRGDVADARNRICAASTRGSLDWPEISRSYRTYVFAATALVEAFINYHVIVAKHRGRDVTAFDGVQGFEARLERWFDSFANRPMTMATLRGRKEWSSLMVLRAARNAMIHATEPTVALSLRDLPAVLNAARAGVGGFLGVLRHAQDLPLLAFIQELKTLPLVEFRSAPRPT